MALFLKTSLELLSERENPKSERQKAKLSVAEQLSSDIRILQKELNPSKFHPYEVKKR